MPVSVVVAASALSLMLAARVAQLALAFEAGTPLERAFTSRLTSGGAVQHNDRS